MLTKDRHPNLDFFVADLRAWSTPIKDDQASMEHAMFSLSKNPAIAMRRYEHNGTMITITPSVIGIPTIWDKDPALGPAGRRLCDAHIIPG